MTRNLDLWTTVLVGWLFVAVGSTAAVHGQEAKASRSLTREVLAIEFNSPRGGSSLMFALWADGYCVWHVLEPGSKSAYRCAKLTAETFDQVVGEIKQAGFFGEKSLQDQRLGPDGANYELKVLTKETKFTMVSWHEPYEGNGKVFASDKGLVPLGGETRLAKLKQEPAEYLFYRFAWLELKSTLLAVRPAESKSCKGEVVVTADGLVWRESESP
jgi:hypothetical protein